MSVDTDNLTRSLSNVDCYSNFGHSRMCSSVVIWLAFYIYGIIPFKIAWIIYHPPIYFIHQSTLCSNPPIWELFFFLSYIIVNWVPFAFWTSGQAKQDVIEDVFLGSGKLWSFHDFLTCHRPNDYWKKSIGRKINNDNNC